MNRIFLRLKKIIISLLEMLKTPKLRYCVLVSKANTPGIKYPGRTVILDRKTGNYVKRNGVVHFFKDVTEAEEEAAKLNYLKKGEKYEKS